MYIETKRITGSDVSGFEIDAESLPAVVTCVAMSDPALAFWWKGRALALVGFVPQAIITDTVYCWVHDLPAARDHRVVFGRQAVLVVREVRKRYPRIVGHCQDTSASRWLASLGAKFGEAQGPLVPFVIEG